MRSRRSLTCDNRSPQIVEIALHHQVHLVSQAVYFLLHFTLAEPRWPKCPIAHALEQWLPRLVGHPVVDQRSGDGDSIVFE